MTHCTHGGTAMRLPLGTRCPYCTQIVAVATPATGHRGEVAPEATPQASLEVPLPATIAAGVAPCRKDGDGPPPVPPAPAATIATPAPTTATPCPALRLPVASPGANAPHGAGVAPSADRCEVCGSECAPGRIPHRCAWCAFDVPDPQPAARMTDPDTAHEAAAAVRDVQRRNVYRAVLEAIVEHGPCTDHDLARYVSGKLGHPIGQTSVGVRRGELRNAGLVADSGHKGRTETGAKAIRWALTPAGIDAAGGVAA